jgi:hypothetical protein
MMAHWAIFEPFGFKERASQRTDKKLAHYLGNPEAFGVLSAVLQSLISSAVKGSYQAFERKSARAKKGGPPDFALLVINDEDIKLSMFPRRMSCT